MSQRDHAKFFIQVIKKQPIAIRYWVADFIINRLPNIDPTVGADHLLEKETGMSFVSSQMIVHSWMFDSTKKIENICFHYLEKKKWIQ